MTSASSDAVPEDLPHHLRHHSHPAPTTASQPGRTADPRHERRHRRLVRLGQLLLALGPALALSHLITDVQLADRTGTFWTYTLASYDITIVITIIGIALTCRASPGPKPGTNGNPGIPEGPTWQHTNANRAKKVSRQSELERTEQAPDE